MEKSKQNCCSICYEILSDSEIVTRSTDILKFLLVNVNHKLLQDAIICEACLAKVQSAYKFKILYSEVSQKSIENVTVKEETNSEELACGICKNSLDPNDNLPLFDSVPNRSTSIERLTLECDLKLSENLRICEKCHKSLLNFCSITNSISIFEQIDIKESVDIDIEGRNDVQQTVDNIVDTNSIQNFKTEIKEDHINNKDVNMNYTLQNIKEDRDSDPTYLEFLLKNEEVEIKDDENELYWKRETQKMSSPGNHSFELNETNIDLVKSPSKPARYNFQAMRTDLSVSKHIDKIENMFRCLDCDFQTKHRRCLKRHALIHSNDVEMFRCNVCSFQTKHKGNLKQHLLTHKADNEIRMFQCNVCIYQTMHKHHLKRHILTHKKEDDVEMVQCNVCMFQSKHKGNLKIHMWIHKNDDKAKIFQCNVCNYGTKHSSNLKRHMLKHKNNARVEIFRCYVCNYQTKYKDDLKNHMLTHKIITENQMFQCYNCKFLTKRKNNLKQHMLTHKPVDQIQMFKCQICTFQSKRKGTLTKHMLIHKPVDQIQMFKCQICTFQSKRKGTLTKHMLIHKPVDQIQMFKCQICSFQSKRKGSLKEHMRTHGNVIC